MAIIDDIKLSYRQGSMLVKLIFINIAVFLLLHLLTLTAAMLSARLSPLSWMAMPSGLDLLLRRPWTLLTYMFTHYGLLHLLFNMLWLYWLGRIFMEFFSPKQLTGLYLLGGWGGALIYLLAYNLLPGLAGANGLLLGASASVIAIVVATAVYVPDYKIGLLFLGAVSLKWVAIVTVVIALIGLEGRNVGGDLAHLGGAAVGALFAVEIRKGIDITRPINSAIDALISLFAACRSSLSRDSRDNEFKMPRGRAGGGPRAAQRPNDQVSEEELDAILKKIKKAGYDALSDDEKDKLFKASRRRSP